MEKPFPAYDGDGDYVFVCYSHADSATIYPELQWLKDQGAHVWYDEGITPGDEFPEALGNAILGANAVLFYVSPRSVNSRHCRDEVYFALSHDVPVLALHIEPTEMPPGLALSTGTTQAIVRHGQRADDYRRKVLQSIANPDPEPADAPARPVKQRSRRGLYLIAVSSAAVLVAAWYGASMLLEQQRRVSWARNEALPEIRRMIDERWSDFTEPYALALEVEKIIPEDPALEEVFATTSLNVDITSEPAGASVYVKPYVHPEEPWQLLGTTPLDDLRLPVGIFRWQFSKPGYTTVVAAHSTWTLDLAGRELLRPNPLIRRLDPEVDSPQGMVRVAGGDTAFGAVGDFWIDRMEVTNRQFQRFVQDGGYQRRELWAEEFHDGGQTLSFEEAQARFLDGSGRPGPATWIGGTFPAGQGDHPVSGVSWYEADAYARWVGSSLPTGTHWGLAQGEYTPIIQFPQLGGMGVLVPFSNFSQKVTVPVGSLPGITSWGAYDMAGNVREWCSNMAPDGRLVRGGGYADSSYRFIELSQTPPMTRSALLGFRTMRMIEDESAPPAVFAEVEFPHVQQLDPTEAADDEVFAYLARRFDYDERPLRTRTLGTRQSDEWTLERIAVDTAYGNETLILNVFLPRNISPPYQPIVYFPGSGSLFQSSSEYIDEYYEFPTFLSFLVKTGRAVIYPVYRGTFERQDPSLIPMHLGGGSNAYRDYFVQLVQDSRRTLDYLDTRDDMDGSRYTLYGMSWGAIYAAVVPALEPRFRAAVLLGGGYVPAGIPETNPVHYAPRLTIPLLMLVGRYDSLINFERAVKPLFELIGTDPRSKRLIVYDTDHVPPKNEFITEILAWLDETLGPVTKQLKSEAD